MFSWTNRPIAVVGGAGFGGAHLCEVLLRRGARVHVLDKVLWSNSYLHFAGLTGKVSFLPVDLRDEAALKVLWERCEFDTIFLLAAQPIVATSNALPLETAQLNIMGTYHALEACRVSRRTRRLIFASSGAYYGATHTQAAINEDAAPLPAANIYAPTKVAADLAVRCYARIYGLQTVVCRWMNTYGPGDTHFSRLVPNTLRRLMRGERALIDGTDGTNILELLHVRDMAEGYLRAAECLDDARVCGEAFNFGSGAPLSLRDAAMQITRAWNAVAGEAIDETPIISGPKVDSIKYLDIQKAARLLNWQPQIALEEGLRETAAWYRQHRDQLGL